MLTPVVVSLECPPYEQAQHGSGEKSDQFTPAAFNCSFSGY